MANLVFNQSYSAKAKQPRAADQEILIDTDVNAAKRAKIVRDGKPVGQITVNQDKIAGVLVGYRPVASRVVTQSIAPGTPIAKGTSVNLVLAEANRIPINVVDGVHLAIQTETMASLYERFLKDDPELVNIVANAATGTAIPAADVAKIEKKAAAKDVSVTNAPGQDVAALMTGLLAAYTFNG